MPHCLIRSITPMITPKVRYERLININVSRQERKTKNVTLVYFIVFYGTGYLVQSTYNLVKSSEGVFI